MKILFFNRSFYPEQAATGQLLTELCEDLVSAGNSVTVVTAPPTTTESNISTTLVRKKIFYTVEEFRGIQILRTRSLKLPKTSMIFRIANYLSYFLFSFLAATRCKGPDVVISLTDPPIIGLVALIYSWFWRSKFVYLCQDIFPQVAFLLTSFRSKMVYSMLEKISKFLLFHAHRIIAIGESMKNKLIQEKEVSPEKIVVIHNWADCNTIVPLSSQEEIKSTFGVNGHFIVMHSGNIGLSQEIEVLIETAKILKDHRDILFVIAGNGVRLQTCINLSKEYRLDNVRFFPYQPKEHLGRFFSIADLFIISLKKGLSGYIVPSKLYGILAAGRPFVAAAEEESEAVSIGMKHGCGLPADPGNPRDLASKILMLYADRELGKKMGEKARQVALQFDRSKQTRAYLDLFLQLTKEPCNSKMA